MPYTVKIGAPPEPRSQTDTNGAAGAARELPIKALVGAGVALVVCLAIAGWLLFGSGGRSSSGEVKKMTFPAGASGPPIPGPSGMGGMGPGSAQVPGALGTR